MTTQIEFQAFVRVKSQDKAQAQVRRLGQAMGLQLAVAACEQYWKDQTLFRVRLVSTLHAGELAPAVLEGLQVCSAVAGKWVVGAPECYEGERWEFSGWAVEDTITLPGLTYIDFSLRNWNRQESPADSAVNTVEKTA